MGVRSFLDEDARLWRVWPDTSQSGDGWLRFQSGAERRRLAPARADLHALGERRLRELLRQAEVEPPSGE